MAKLKVIAFANTVKVGRNENLLFQNDRYDIDILDSVKVRIKCQQTGDVKFSSLFNAKWWEEEGAKPEPKKPVAKKVAGKKL